MKFKIDENLPSEVVELLRSAGHDAHSVLDESIGGASDESIAEICREEGRILLMLTSASADILQASCLQGAEADDAIWGCCTCTCESDGGELADDVFAPH